MPTVYKWEVFRTSEELDIRIKSYINMTADDLVVNLRKRKNRNEAVAV